MKLKKYLLLTGIFVVICLSLILLFPVEDIGAQNELKGKIVYVDIWKVFNVHPEKEAAEKELNQLAQSMQSELESEAHNLPAGQQQEMLKQYQTKLSQREQELITDIINNIKDIIMDIAEEKEVSLVLDKKNIIYGGYDMTQDVIDYIQENSEEPESSNQETIAEEINTDQPSNEEINNE